MKNIFYLMIVSFFINACNDQKIVEQQTVNQEEESKKLMKVSRQWANSASPGEFLSYWNNESLFMEPGKSIVKGQANIAKVLEVITAIPGFGITWEPQEAFVSASGDLGYVISKILVTYNDENNEQIKLFEKGVEIWKRQADGSWKNVVDIWNVDPSLTSIHK
ncbi:MAG: DUF4440 domain-containing protein [Reichenbachiella sp.]|uniref:YybH family protein n=1 Tax=Reichenbachiella sp. TaxID=2184521 RepID=UPI00326736D6